MDSFTPLIAHLMLLSLAPLSLGEPVANFQPRQAVTVTEKSGPKSSSILFIVFITLGGVAFILAASFTIYYTITYKDRVARRRTAAAAAAAASAVTPGHELQPTSAVVETREEIQSAPSPEAYGYYAPALDSGLRTTISKREIYG